MWFVVVLSSGYDHMISMLIEAKYSPWYTINILDYSFESHLFGMLIFNLQSMLAQPTKIKKKLFSFMSNLQFYYHFNLDFQKVDRHTGSEWLIRGTKRHKGNQLQSLELPCRIS